MNARTTFPHRTWSRSAVAAASEFLCIQPDAFARNQYGRLYRLPRVIKERTRLFVFLRVMWNWPYPKITRYCGLMGHATAYDQIHAAIKPEEYPAYRAAMLNRLNAHRPDFFDPPPFIPAAKPKPPTPTVAAKPRRQRKPRPRRHGYGCPCLACRELSTLGDRLAARAPINPSRLEKMVRPYYIAACRKLGDVA